MGKNQMLPNGNVLVIEPEGGRVFEVTSDSKIVWEYMNRWDDKYIVAMTDAIRYPVGYFDFPLAECN